MKKQKLLNYTLYCVDCTIECVDTEKGILCPSCGAYISDEEVGIEDFS